MFPDGVNHLVLSSVYCCSVIHEFVLHFGADVDRDFNRVDKPYVILRHIK